MSLQEPAVTRSPMTVPGLKGAYVSYNAADFEPTCDFYEKVLGCTRVTSWNRADGQGAYFAFGGVAVAEILAAAAGSAALEPPPAGSFSIVLVVNDLAAACAAIADRGGVIVDAPARENWGSWAGLRDPNGVAVHLVEQT
jgi:predicted enzyme related to lactoylglutathione lyase